MVKDYLINHTFKSKVIVKFMNKEDLEVLQLNHFRIFHKSHPLDPEGS